MIYDAPRKKIRCKEAGGIGSVRRKLAAGLADPEEEKNACLNVPGVFFA